MSLNRACSQVQSSLDGLCQWLVPQWQTATRDHTAVSLFHVMEVERTKNTLLAAVRFKPTAPDLSEMSMTRGFVSLFLAVTGRWKVVMTSCRYDQRLFQLDCTPFSHSYSRRIDKMGLPLLSTRPRPSRETR